MRSALSLPVLPTTDPTSVNCWSRMCRVIALRAERAPPPLCWHSPLLPLSADRPSPCMLTELPPPQYANRAQSLPQCTCAVRPPPPPPPPSLPNVLTERWATGRSSRVWGVDCGGTSKSTSTSSRKVSDELVLIQSTRSNVGVLGQKVIEWAAQRFR